MSHCRYLVITSFAACYIVCHELVTRNVLQLIYINLVIRSKKCFSRSVGSRLYVCGFISQEKHPFRA